MQILLLFYFNLKKKKQINKRKYYLIQCTSLNSRVYILCHMLKQKLLELFQIDILTIRFSNSKI